MSKTKLETKPLTTTAQKELKTLKKLINDGHDTIEMMKAKIQGENNKVLAEAVLEGDRLNRVKKMMPYGLFTRWVKDNCKKISIRTAQRYMVLATRKTELLTTDVGLRKAYALLGIIKDEQLVDETLGNAVIQQPTIKTTVKPPVKTLAQQAADKARKVTTAQPQISKTDAMSRAKYLVQELTNELTNKLNSELILKADARQIVQPLTDLLN